MPLGEKIALGIVGVDALLILGAIVVSAGQKRQERLQQEREAQHPYTDYVSTKGPPND